MSVAIDRVEEIVSTLQKASYTQLAAVARTLLDTEVYTDFRGDDALFYEGVRQGKEDMSEDVLAQLGICHHA